MQFVFPLLCAVDVMDEEQKTLICLMPSDILQESGGILQEVALEGILLVSHHWGVQT